MKKLKHIIFAVIMIIIVISILFGKNITSSAVNNAWQPSRMTVRLGQYWNGMSGNALMTRYWNVYCIEKDQALRDGMNYHVSAKVEIRGYTATFYDSDGSVDATVVAEENNVMGAIVTPNSYIEGGVPDYRKDEWWSIGMYNDYGSAVQAYNKKTIPFTFYSRAQVSLYRYLPKWKRALRANGYSLGWVIATGGAEDIEYSTDEVASELGTTHLPREPTISDGACQHR